MFVDDVMGRSRKHPSCVLHFSSSIDPLTHISADFPSLAQRDVERPASPLATCVKIWKVFPKHLFCLRLFVFHCLFIPYQTEDSVLVECNAASRGKRFPTFRKYSAFIFRGLRGPIGHVVSNIHKYIILQLSVSGCRLQNSSRNREFINLDLIFNMNLKGKAILVRA